MAKKFETIGDYEIMIEDDNSVSVVRKYKDNAMSAIRDMVSANDLDVSAFENETQRGFVHKILATYGNLQERPNGKEVGTIGEYTVAIYPADSVRGMIVTRRYTDTMVGLKEVADFIRYEGDPVESGWSEYAYASNICYYIPVRRRICSIFDTERYYEYIERGLENDQVFDQTFKNTSSSVLRINQSGSKSIDKDWMSKNYPDIHMKYVDLVLQREGSYALVCKNLSQRRYDGLLLDNIDRIPDNADRENWEEFVRFVLKREEYPIPSYQGGDYLINFNEMHIAARCMEMPEYLEGDSLQTVFLSDEPIP